jgi:hypothetical protein
MIAAYSSAGEASFEALATAKEYRNNLIEKYKNEHFGEEPPTDVLNNINTQAESLGKTSFFGNLALLGLTEYAQLPKLMGSTYAAERQAANSLLGAAEDVVIRDGKYVRLGADATKTAKRLEGAKRIGGYFFDPKESAQEIGQYALQVGATNYYNKGFEGKEANVWTDGFLYGLTGVNEKGIAEGALVSKEGIIGGITGGITGGVMQAMRGHKIHKATQSNTDKFISELDGAPSFKVAFKDKLNHANRAIALQQEQEAATLVGDKLHARDLNTDLMHNYLTPRIKYGRFDMIMEDFNDMRIEVDSPGGLSDLKTQGYANMNDTRESFLKRLDTLEKAAVNTNEIYKSHDLRFSGQIMTDKEGNPMKDGNGNTLRKYPPSVIDKMVYSTVKIADYETRIPQVNNTLTRVNVPTYEILESIIENNKPNKEATKKAIDAINKLNVTDNIKDELKSNLSDVIEMSRRRQSFLQEYNDMKDKPANYIHKEDDFMPGQKADLPVDISQKLTVDGETEIVQKRMEVGKEYPLKEALRLDGGSLTLAPKIAVVAHTLGGEYEVKMPDGSTKFFTPEEFEQFNIGEEDNAFPEMEQMLNDVIDDVLARPEHEDSKKELAKAKHKDFQSKLFNLSNIDDNKLNKAIVEEFNNRYDDFMTAAKQRAEREAIYRERREAWSKAQNTIVQKSGDDPGVDTSTVTNGKEPPKKDESELFKATATESEDWYDPSGSSPHIVRSRVFMNQIDNFENRKNIRAILVHAGNAEALGLGGIVQLSYGRELNTPLSEIENSTDVNKGFLAQVYMIIETEDIFHVDDETGRRTKVGEETNDYFVDEKGNKLTKVGEKADLDKVIFQTMPTTELTWSNGEARYRKEQKEDAEGQAIGYSKFRNELFSASPAEYDKHEITVSKGFAIENIPREFNQVGNLLIDEDKIATVQDIVVIPTKGSVSHNGINYKFPDGVPIFKFGSKIAFLNNRNINQNQADTLYELIKQVTDNLKSQLTSNQPINIESPELDFIRNILYWNTKKTDSPSAISISETNMNLTIGGLSIPLTEVEMRRDEIIDQLKKAWFSTNNKTLKNDFTKEFTEYYMDKDSKLQLRQWKNYQLYLLSSNYPNGNNRPAEITPLTTSISKPTDEVPYSFKQKYAVLQDLHYEVPPKKTKITSKQPGPGVVPTAVTPTVMIVDVASTPVNIGNDVENIIQDDVVGELKFKVNIEGGLPVINITGGQGYNEFVNKPRTKMPPKIKQYLEEKEMYNEEGTIIENLNRFFSTRLFAKVSVAMKNYVPPVAPIAPVEPAPTVMIVQIGDSQVSIGNDVENTIKDEVVGDLRFKATLDENNKPIIEITGGSKMYNDLIAKAKVPPKIKKYLEDKEMYDENGTVKENIDRFLSTRTFAKVSIAMKTPAQQAPTQQTPISKAKEIVKIIESPAVSKTIDEFTNTNLDRDGKENLLQDDIKDIVENYGIDEQSVADYMKQQGTTLVKAVWRSNKDDFFKMLNLWKEGTILKYGQQPAEIVVQPTATDNGGRLDTPFNDDTSVAARRQAKLDAAAKSAKKRGFRVVGPGGNSIERMTPEDLDIFKEWAADKLPLIPWEDLERMIITNDGRFAWGVFEDGVAKFVRGGLRGTEYHEMFEAIWNGILSPGEQQALLDEFKSKSGFFTDRETKTRIAYSEATDEQAKERIADDFSDYRLGKLPARSLGETIKNFFRRIINFVKSFLVQPTLKNQMFEAIEKGEFRERALSRESKEAPSQYRAADQMNETDTHMFVEDMLAKVAGILKRDGRKDLLYTPQPIESEEVWNEIWSMYEEDGWDDEISPLAWKQLKEKVNDRLGTLGFAAETDENANINTVGTTKNEYAKETFAPEGKNSASRAVKFDLATTIERESTVQTKAATFERPEPKFEKGKEGFYKLVNFNKMYSTLLDKLSNTSSVFNFIGKIVDLANEDGNFVSVFERIGGKVVNHNDPSQSAKNKQIDFQSFKFNDWRLFIDYFQTFGTRQKPEALIQYKILGETYTGSANLFNVASLELNKWMENMRSTAKSKDETHTFVVNHEEKKFPKLVTYNRATQTYTVDKKALESYPVKLVSEQMRFLQALGVEFTMSTHRKLKTEERKNKFADAVKGLHSYIAENPSVMTLNGKILDVKGHFNTLSELYVTVESPNQDPTYFGVEGQKVGSYSENNVPSVFENMFNEVKTLEDLLEQLPQLKDIFSTGSEILRAGGRFFNSAGDRTTVPLKVKYIQGNKDTDNNKGKTTSSLGLGQRFSLEINQNINGDYYILIPADGTTEWMMNLGNNISFKDFNGNATRANDKKRDIFMRYLVDDIMLALDSPNRSRLKNVKGRGKELRFFKDFLSTTDKGQVLLRLINERLNTERPTYEDIKSLIEGNVPTIMEAVNVYIEDTVVQTRENLEATNQLEMFDEELRLYNYKALDSEFANSNKINPHKMSETTANQILRFVNTNYIINNIEYHKFIIW